MKDEGWTPTMLASISGSTERLALLVSAGAEVNTKDSENRTAAMHAAWSGSPDCLALLIAAGSDLSVRDVHQKTALDLAQSRDQIECIERIRSVLDARNISAALKFVTNPVRGEAPRKTRI